MDQHMTESDCACGARRLGMSEGQTEDLQSIMKRKVDILIRHPL